MKFAFAFVLACVISLTPAHGDGVEISTGVVCNTRQQMERFVALNEADPSAAIRAVNAEHNDPSACVVASLAFVRGRDAGTVRKNDAAFRIVRIMVVGIVTEGGIRPVAPAVHFALFSIEEGNA